jgi:serine/threonine protein kinase
MERSGIRVADTFEQVRGESTIDYRADLFALGAILYEMLSGRRAFQAGSAVETMNATSGFTCFRASSARCRGGSTFDPHFAKDFL